MSALHVHAPEPVNVNLTRFACPTCERRSYGVLGAYEWYGPSLTCLRCGEQWQDGERLPRPFAPRWRQRSVERAKRFYRNHCRRTVDTSPGAT